jgi:cell division protein FtsL
MVMAGALEFAKLVAATYLKQMWGEIKGFNKWYLVSAVALLMLITSAGIFGYLSNAFQAQSLKLQQVDREIMVHSTKIDQNTIQITQLSTQISEFNKNQGKIIDGGKVNSRLLRSIDNRDKEIAKINKKISDLQDQNAKENEKINEIKTSNIDLEKEVGGFRFVAEAFGVELKNVVKFFIFLIVIVFDPLAVALIIAFNGLIETKKQKQSRLLGEMMEYDQKLGLYEVYGDDIINETEKNEINKTNEITSTNTTDVVANSTPNDEDIEETPSLKWEEFMHPDFQWQKRNLWINNPKAVNYWLKSKGGSVRELVKIKNEEENIKTY